MKKADLRLQDYLGHITQAIERINAYTTGIDKEGWLGNTLVQDAVIRNIEIIGEAAHNVQTDLDIVWKTITSELPAFLAMIRAMP